MTVAVSESKRIEALNRYGILDTPQDGSFNRLTSLAAKIFNVPISIISLVDTDRIWFKSHHGLDVNEIKSEPGLCTSAIMSDDVYVVEDAKSDPRTLTNSLVTSDFGLQFYAGAPLQTSDGYNLGTLCIIDKKQRYITDAQKDILKELANIAMDEIEIRLAARNNARKTNKLLHDTRSLLSNVAREIEAIPETERNENLNAVIQHSDHIIQQIKHHFKNQVKEQLK